MRNSAHSPGGSRATGPAPRDNRVAGYLLRRLAQVAVVVALVYYVFVTWMMGVGYGVANAGKWAQDPAALDTLATRYVGSRFATLVDIAVVVDAFVAALAYALTPYSLNFAARLSVLPARCRLRRASTPSRARRTATPTGPWSAA